MLENATGEPGVGVRGKTHKTCSCNTFAKVATPMSYFKSIILEYLKLLPIATRHLCFLSLEQRNPMQ